MRCLLETMDHNVDQFLSLAGVQVVKNTYFFN